MTLRALFTRGIAAPKALNMVKRLYFLAIMLTAIAMGAALAHLFELPNKINLGAADYLTVQRNYDNWWIVGLSVPLAVLSVLALTVGLRGTGAPFTFALLALLLLIGELVVFWGFTAPSTARPIMGTLVMSVLDWRSMPNQ
jgi:hypothetical protein